MALRVMVKVTIAWCIIGSARGQERAFPPVSKTLTQTSTPIENIPDSSNTGTDTDSSDLRNIFSRATEDGQNEVFSRSKSQNVSLHHTSLCTKIPSFAPLTAHESTYLNIELSSHDFIELVEEYVNTLKQESVVLRYDGEDTADDEARRLAMFETNNIALCASVLVSNLKVDTDHLSTTQHQTLQPLLVLNEVGKEAKYPASREVCVHFEPSETSRGSQCIAAFDLAASRSRKENHVKDLNFTQYPGYVTESKTKFDKLKESDMVVCRDYSVRENVENLYNKFADLMASVEQTFSLFGIDLEVFGCPVGFADFSNEEYVSALECLAKAVTADKESLKERQKRSLNFLDLFGVATQAETRMIKDMIGHDTKTLLKNEQMLHKSLLKERDYMAKLADATQATEAEMQRSIAHLLTVSSLRGKLLANQWSIIAIFQSIAMSFQSLAETSDLMRQVVSQTNNALDFACLNKLCWRPSSTISKVKEGIARVQAQESQVTLTPVVRLSCELFRDSDPENVDTYTHPLAHRTLTQGAAGLIDLESKQPITDQCISRAEGCPSEPQVVDRDTLIYHTLHFIMDKTGQVAIQCLDSQEVLFEKDGDIKSVMCGLNASVVDLPLSIMGKKIDRHHFRAQLSKYKLGKRNFLSSNEYQKIKTAEPEVEIEWDSIVGDITDLFWQGYEADNPVHSSFVTVSCVSGAIIIIAVVSCMYPAQAAMARRISIRTCTVICNILGCCVKSCCGGKSAEVADSDTERDMSMSGGGNIVRPGANTYPAKHQAPRQQSLTPPRPSAPPWGGSTSSTSTRDPGSSTSPLSLSSGQTSVPPSDLSLHTVGSSDLSRADTIPMVQLPATSEMSARGVAPLSRQQPIVPGAPTTSYPGLINQSISTSQTHPLTHAGVRQQQIGRNLAVQQHSGPQLSPINSAVSAPRVRGATQP